MAHAQHRVANPITDLPGAIKKNLKHSLIAAAIFSGIANMLMLVPAFFMLNVYDKAIGSNSLSTLAVLSIIAVVMFCGLATMEALRTWILIAIGKKLDILVGPVIYEATFQNAAKFGLQHSGTQPLNDFANLRQFISGNGAITVFDTPWIPIYLFVMFLFHPMLGWMGVVSAIAMLTLALVNQRSTTGGLQAANSLLQKNMNEASRQFKNAEVAASMGMFDAMQRKWRHEQDEVIAKQEQVSKLNGVFSASTKTLRLAVQSVAIAVGAILVLQQEISPGMLIAGSILVGRALQPIELAVGSWRGFIDAKGQYQRLKQLLRQSDWQRDKMALPKLVGSVSGRTASITPPGATHPTIRDATFQIPSGAVCMVVGPSGAGKSTLIRGVLGLWPTSEGDIRIDGTEAAHYERSDIGPQIGYLPQDIEIFDGSVSANIARLGEVNAEAVIMAAEDAGMHEFILSLPGGYDTVLGQESGVVLSPGQRQRLALARALYRRPQLVVLDEPNSNLDQFGEAALNRAIEILKGQGSTVIIVSHRQGAMDHADQLMVVSSGTVIDSGAPAAVMARLRQTQAVSPLSSATKNARENGTPPIKTVPV